MTKLAVARRFRVVIVGGGSSGWMTAAYLSKAFGERIDVQLVESGSINTIGVGEATFSDIHLFFRFLELSEDEWMPHCNASYKVAIRFVGWNRESRSFYHPFERPGLVDGRSLAEWWLRLRPRAAYDEACFLSSRLCDLRRSPRFKNGATYLAGDVRPDAPTSYREPLLLDDHQSQYPYAYHFDAGLFAKFLAGYATRRGVRHTIDDVLDVELGEDGAIRTVLTKEHGRIAADLFVDCTGFSGLLINKALGEPFISFLESLPCDSAVAMQVPHDAASDGLEPYTSATALSAGWVWNIPLYHRVGTGYVYSSAFLDRDAAEREFRAYLGKRADGVRAAHIKMRIGRCRRSWVKNCVAIGLASGFVEPLESTGLFFVQHGIEQLVTHFPGPGRFDEASIRSYNDIVGACIDGVREFLTLHYVASSRSDTLFWSATKQDLAISAELTERLDLWRSRLPTRRTIRPAYHGFGAHNYVAMLMGLGWLPPSSLPVLEHLDDANAQAEFQRIRRRSAMLARSLPSLYEYLRERREQGHERQRQSIGAV